MVIGLIEELAKVIVETKRVEQKIHETRGQLSCIKKKISETLVHRYLGDGNIIVEEDLMKAEQTYERLMQALLDMKKNFEHQMRSLDEQIVQANIMHLRAVFEEKKNLLADYVDGIDQKILGCLAHVEEYRRIHADLNELSERLHLLGVDSLEIPERLHSEELIEILGDRVQHLRFQGKL
ncbi:MAG: hypothetical protein ACREQW_21445 [Candidatus Binatia bacterium]